MNSRSQAKGDRQKKAQRKVTGERLKKTHKTQKKTQKDTKSKHITMLTHTLHTKTSGTRTHTARRFTAANPGLTQSQPGRGQVHLEQHSLAAGPALSRGFGPAAAQPQLHDGHGFVEAGPGGLGGALEVDPPSDPGQGQAARPPAFEAGALGESPVDGGAVLAPGGQQEIGLGLGELGLGVGRGEKGGGGEVGGEGS